MDSVIAIQDLYSSEKIYNANNVPLINSTMDMPVYVKSDTQETQAEYVSETLLLHVDKIKSMIMFLISVSVIQELVWLMDNVKYPPTVQLTLYGMVLDVSATLDIYSLMGSVDSQQIQSQFAQPIAPSMV